MIGATVHSWHCHHPTYDQCPNHPTSEDLPPTITGFLEVSRTKDPFERIEFSCRWVSDTRASLSGGNAYWVGLTGFKVQPC
jgi:hypothetical protein